MMLALHGRPSHVEAFPYQLAERLHKTVSEIEALPHAELVGWAAYLTAKQAIEAVRGAHGS
jgi:hypothetical protein